jgi:hypothetical protein
MPQNSLTYQNLIVRAHWTLSASFYFPSALTPNQLAFNNIVAEPHWRMDHFQLHGPIAIVGVSPYQ